MKQIGNREAVNGSAWRGASVYRIESSFAPVTSDSPRDVRFRALMSIFERSASSVVTLAARFPALLSYENGTGIAVIASTACAVSSLMPGGLVVRLIYSFYLVVVTALLVACQHVSHQPPTRVSLAIINVTVIDPENGQTLPNHSVFIEGARIVAVVPTARSEAYTPAKVVDGSGRFLIPGLMDMHIHLFLPGPAAPTLGLLLANGVTGIREMSSDCWELLGAREGCVSEYKALQAKVKAGEVPGPELLSLTSTMVMGPSRGTLPEGVAPFITPKTPAQARQLVQYLRGRGVDRIKTHDSIGREAFYAMMAEARAQSLEVVGHVPFGAGSLEAARRGYGSIEHARDLLYDCSRYGPVFRGVMNDVADQKKGAAAPKNVERLRQTVAEYDRGLCDRFLSQLANTGTYYVPTHVTREMEALAGDPAYRNDPLRMYVMKERNDSWEKDLNETAALPAEERTALTRFFEHGLQITRMAHAAGIPIMAGTDASDTMIFPGFSLHRELGLLVRAGLSPMDALRAATTVPAKYMGKTAVYGGISPGKEADLVLLKASPLLDIRSLKSIEAVIANGKLLDRSALDGLLREAQRAAASSRASGP